MKERLYIVITILTTILFSFCISKFNDNTYYYLYPQFTYEYTWGIILFTIIFFIGLILTYKTYRISLRGKLFLYTTFILFGLINTAFFIGGIQFLIYLTDKDSFIIDADIKNYELNIERSTLNRIEQKLIKDRAICILAVANLKKEKITITKKTNTSFIGIESSKTTSFLLITKNVQIQLNKMWNHLPEDPTHPDTTNTVVFHYDITAKGRRHSVDFTMTDEEKKILATYFKNPYVIDRKNLIEIFETKNLEINKNIITLEKNKHLIEKRGLPLSQFTYDSFMKSLQQDPEIFKMLSWKSRIVHILHLIIIAFILLPFISDLTDKWKNRIPFYR